MGSGLPSCKMCGWSCDRSLCICLITVVAFLFAGVQAIAQSDTPESSPTTITSEIMTVHNKERKAVFEGNVVLIRSNLTVRSDAMVVFFAPEKKRNNHPDPPSDNRGSQDRIQKVEASGHVVIEQEGKKAECQRAEYFRQEEKLVLTGNPVAWQDGTRVSGEKMTLFLEENRSIVEGGSRVVLQGE